MTKIETPRPWIRLYTEFATDPIIQSLSFEDQRHYIQILLMKGGAILDRRLEPEVRERIIRKTIGLEPEFAESAKNRLISIGLIDKNWQPLAWDKRQFEGDFSTNRVRKHRENKKKEGTECNVTETLHKRSCNAPDTDTDTETDTETETENRGSSTHPPANRGISPSNQDIKNTHVSSGSKPDRKNTPQAAEGVYPESFLQCWQIWKNRLPREGGNSKASAFKQWQARINQGHPEEELYEGTLRYAAYCESAGTVGTRYVKMASTFYGQDRHFQEDWIPAKNGNGKPSLAERAQAVIDHFTNESHIIDGECYETH